MSFFGAVEVVDRTGHVQARVRVERLPFRIGRALDNDLVLDDPYVCPHHAELRGEETLELVDCSSRNGSFFGAERARRERIGLGEGCELRLGHTHLRFRAVSERLAATLADPMTGSRWLGLDRWRWGIAALAGSAAVVVGEHIVGSSQALRPGVMAGATAPALIVLALWALSWSLVNRVVAHRFHYVGHLVIGCLAVIAGSAMETVGAYLGFAFAADETVSALNVLIGAVLIAVVIFGHLRLISTGSSRRLLAPAALVGLAFLALMTLPDAADDRFSSEPRFTRSLKLPAAAWRTGRTSETFYADAVVALDAADAEAEESDEAK
jgi:hypothetical protein